MSYDEKLYQRIAAFLQSTKGIEPKKMFGGVCFMHNGNMLCGVDGSRLMVRVGPEQYEQALTLKHASVMNFTGKPLKGFIFVSPAGTQSAKDLRKWVDLGLRFTSSLPAKKTKRNPKRSAGTTPLKKVKNFGPVTYAEFESMGITTLEQVIKLGFEATCRKWVQYYPERLNANAFLGVACAIDGTVWTRATVEHRKEAHKLVRVLRREFNLPAVNSVRKWRSR